MFRSMRKMAGRMSRRKCNGGLVERFAAGELPAPVVKRHSPAGPGDRSCCSRCSRSRPWSAGRARCGTRRVAVEDAAHACAGPATGSDDWEPALAHRHRVASARRKRESVLNARPTP